jgi:hypothetical protein
MTGYDLGRQGELHILSLLQDAGLDATLSENGGPDITLGNGLTIEVKAARLSRRAQCRGKRYQFSLYREQRGKVKTDVRRADLVCLLCYNGKLTPAAVFVIPVSRLGDRRHLAIPGNLAGYVGQWSWFRGWTRAIKELEMEAL